MSGEKTSDSHRNKVASLYLSKQHSAHHLTSLVSCIHYGAARNSLPLDRYPCRVRDYRHRLSVYFLNLVAAHLVLAKNPFFALQGSLEVVSI